MNKSNQQSGIGPLVIIIVIALAGVLGWGVYRTVKMNNQAKVEEQSNTNGEENSGTKVNSSASVNARGSLRGLLGMGKTQMCTFTGTNANGTVAGTMYISGDQMRGDFTTTETGVPAINSSMIRQGGTVYAWSGSQGAKMSFGNMTSASATAKNNVNLDQSVDYKCSPWTMDATKFAVPSTVKFIDVEAMLKGTTNIKY